MTLPPLRIGSLCDRGAVAVYGRGCLCCMCPIRGHCTSPAQQLVWPRNRRRCWSQQGAGDVITSHIDWPQHQRSLAPSAAFDPPRLRQPPGAHGHKPPKRDSTRTTVPTTRVISSAPSPGPPTKDFLSNLFAPSSQYQIVFGDTGLRR